MRFAASYLFTTFILAMTFIGAEGHADCSDHAQAFTGKITRARVRMRLQPTLESPIIRELDREDLLIITDMVDDFYAVKPPTDTKAFVYRTFVLDGVVEGNRVNVRLDPHLDAPIIGQLNTGYRINGRISPLNSKWLEINPPEDTRFYVATEFVEKIGGPDHFATIEKRRDDVSRIINSSYLIAQSELQKPFPETDLDTVFANFNKVINEYDDFPEQVKRAKELLAKIQESYLHKKVAYLESKTDDHTDVWKARSTKLAEEMHEKEEKLASLEQQLSIANREQSATEFYREWLNTQSPSMLSNKMTVWIPVEIAIYEEWADTHGNKSINEFYKRQSKDAIALRGIVQAYSRPIHNKPGDFILVNRSNNLPIAYLYSTQINLQDKIGQHVTVEAVLRPNNHFAYPAYFVLTAE